MHSTYYWKIKVLCGVLLIFAVIDHYLLHTLHYMQWVPRIVAQGFVLIGAGITIYHYYLLTRDNRDISQPETLLIHPGLYRVLRHPMYLGDMVLYAGLFLLASGWPALIVFLLGIYALYRQAQVEDDYLQSRFGEAFCNWRDSSGLLWPVIK